MCNCGKCHECKSSARKDQEIKGNDSYKHVKKETTSNDGKSYKKEEYTEKNDKNNDAK